LNKLEIEKQKQIIIINENEIKNDKEINDLLKQQIMKKDKQIERGISFIY